MPDSVPVGNPKGLFCPHCRGVRLTVRFIKVPRPGLRVRYRQCSTCGAHLKTHETIVPQKKAHR